LVKAGLAVPKAECVPSVVHARVPDQTLNIDLCVVPISHEASQEMISASLAAAAEDFFPTDGSSQP